MTGTEGHAAAHFEITCLNADDGSIAHTVAAAGVHARVQWAGRHRVTGRVHSRTTPAARIALGTQVDQQERGEAS